MPVIEPVPWEDLDPELQEMIEAGRATGMLSTTVPSQIFAYRPALAKLHLERYREIFHGILEPRLLELVRLRLASYNDCEPCQTARKSDEVSEDDVACLSADDDRFSPRERLALRFTDLFVTDHLSIDAACYASLATVFSTPEIIELAMFVGGVLGTGRLTHTLHVFSDEAPVIAYQGELRAT
jgi:alkylhydroperoxidase family enzyme